MKITLVIFLVILANTLMIVGNRLDIIRLDHKKLNCPTDGKIVVSDFDFRDTWTWKKDGKPVGNIRLLQFIDNTKGR